MTARMKWWTVGLAVGILGGGATLAFVKLRPHVAARIQARKKAGSEQVPVQTMSPPKATDFTMEVRQPAYVVPYYTVDLRSRVPGPISYLVKSLGSEVKAGEKLVEIDVPDLRQDVEKKQSVILQRKSEVKLAEANMRVAAQAIAIAESRVEVKKAEVEAAEATREFRQLQLTRFEGLADDKAATLSLVAEHQRYLKAAVASSKAARAEVKKAQADKSEAEAKKDAAEDDVKLKKAMEVVAEQDRDQAKAYLDYATILAPFDGSILRRNVDPGTFVQSGATGQTEPLMTLERTDIVTVYMNVPDTFARYVREGTDAIIELPGLRLKGQVTRRSPSLQTPAHDRTMRVEVDFYNRSEAEYRQFLARAKQNKGAKLKDGKLPGFPRIVWGERTISEGTQLLPGTYGEMKLVLRKFSEGYLVPQRCILSRGGKPYVCLVDKNVVRLVPIEIQAEDKERAKVVLLREVGGQTVKRELSGNEELVVVKNAQGETKVSLNDGQKVVATKLPK